MRKRLFIATLFAASTAFAATGIGHAQAELSTPLQLTNFQVVNFGTVAIDPAAGVQTVSISAGGAITCPAAYVCGGSPMAGEFLVQGELNAAIEVDMTGETATLSDGTGNTLIFDPNLGASDSSSTSLDGVGRRWMAVGGEISFTGSEPGGTYSSQSAGGNGYQITVNY